jgi:peroxiredoxin
LHDQIETLGLDNIKVYGISYDNQSSLKKFSDDFNIGYDLLADEDSAVIKKFGILNTTIDADTTIMDRATGRSYYGLPFPGVYVTDEKGVVIEKFFYRHYASRASAGTIMNSALGEILMPKESPRESFSNDQIKITAFLADDALKFEYYSKIYVRLELEEGLHIYGGDLPDGFVATTVSVDETKGLRAANPVYPETSSKEFKELDVTLDVYDGVIDIEVPVSLTAEVMNWIIRDKPDFMDIPLNVTYQACSDSVCYTPKTQKITVKIPVKDLVMPGMKRQ